MHTSTLSLKDSAAKRFSAVDVLKELFFKSLKFTPEEAQKVLIIGRIFLCNEASGNYQIYV